MRIVMRAGVVRAPLVIPLSFTSCVMHRPKASTTRVSLGREVLPCSRSGWRDGEPRRTSTRTVDRAAILVPWACQCFLCAEKIQKVIIKLYFLFLYNSKTWV